jgi:hypothetical protein
VPRRLSLDRDVASRPAGTATDAVTSPRMAGCCNSRGCDWFFSDRFARRVAKRYRKRGLDKPSQQIVEFLHSRGVKGATVLEIGGGVGEIQLELLKRGAAGTITSSSRPPTTSKPPSWPAKPASRIAWSGACTTSPSIPPSRSCPCTGTWRRSVRLELA